MNSTKTTAHRAGALHFLFMLVAGVAYLVTSTTSIGAPEHRQAVSRLMMPLYFGDVPIILWLLVMGAKVPQPQVRAAGAG